MKRTHPLEYVAEEFCGDQTPQSVRWIADQIRAGRFTAAKVRGRWRMSDADIAGAWSTCSNGPKESAPEAEPIGPRVLSFTPTSARRVAS